MAGDHFWKYQQKRIIGRESGEKLNPIYSSGKKWTFFSHQWWNWGVRRWRFIRRNRIKKFSGENEKLGCKAEKIVFCDTTFIFQWQSQRIYLYNSFLSVCLRFSIREPPKRYFWRAKKIISTIIGSSEISVGDPQIENFGHIFGTHF